MEIEEIWKEEVERRVRAYNEGRLEIISYEDIQYELYVNEKIEAGLDDIEKGNVLTEEEMDKEIDSWFL